MSRRRAALAALLLAAVAATVPGGCTNRADDTSGGGGISLPSFPSVELRMDSVVMVGDSITEGSAIVLQDTLTTAGFSDVVVDGDASRRIEVGTGAGGGPVSGLRTILRLIAEGASPDVWVIELGTNDIGAYTEAEYRDLITQVLDLLPATVPLVWVNTFRPDQPEHTVLFNGLLTETLAARGHSAIADWYTAAAAPDQAILRSDMLHPNETGQVALAMLVVDALSRLPAA